MSTFEENRMDPTDPRLTAYALGELEGDDADRVAAAVAADPALQQAVDEIRDTAARLTAALEAEPLPLAVPPVRVEPYRTVRPARIFQWPYWGVAALGAAACIVVIINLRETPRAPRPAPAVADGGGAAAAGTAAADRVQPSNRVEVVFPPKSAEVAESGSSTDTEQWGQVVPNSTAARAPAPGSAPADRPGRMASSRMVRVGPAPAGQVETAGGRFDHDFVAASRDARSSFDIDVPTAGYAEVRRLLSLGQRPPPAVVRIEELVNAFAYRYAAPAPADPAPIAASLEVASAPWAPAHRLVRIGLKARSVPALVARDVQVQVEFNPARVHAYRLIGFENRLPQTGRPADGIDGRDLAAGHAVTALYEVIPTGAERKPDAAADPVVPVSSGFRVLGSESLDANPEPRTKNPELLTVAVSYRPLAGGDSRRLEFPLVDRGTAFADASPDFKFAAAVAGFGLVLRDSPHRGAATLAAVEQWADEGTGSDAGGARAEFIALVRRAEQVLRSRG